MSNAKTNTIFGIDVATDALVVVGAGPVGLVSSLLLSRFQIPHVLVEQQTGQEEHPQAHFINHRSMEVLRELGRLDQEVMACSANKEAWRRFVYCTNLVDLPGTTDGNAGGQGSMLGVVDHFASNRTDDHSPCQVTHFPQHDFVRLLRRRARESPFCHFIEGCRADLLETANKVIVGLTDLQTKQRHMLPAPLVIGADGAHSSIREGLGIKLADQSGTLQQLVNVHFFSRSLAERLRTTIPAMLYFIYAPAGVGVIVAHALSRGEFVAQIPFFPPLQPFSAFDAQRCVRLIQQLIGREVSVQVNSIRQWSMRVALSARFRSRGGRCFLVGDAAHQFTPAGGFGMNTGIQDAHNLIWKIALARNHRKAGNHHEAERLLCTYESERRPVAVNTARWSIDNYEKTLAVPRALGLNPCLAGLLQRLLNRIPAPLPAKRAFFAVAMGAGLEQINWLRTDQIIARYRRRTLKSIFHNAKSQTLQLLFPGQDLGVTYAPAGATRPAVDAATADPTQYTPSLRIGGRMPHFWIVRDTGQPLSVLDLPRLLMDDDRIPQHILIFTGATDHRFEEGVEMHKDQLKPYRTVFIGAPPAPPGAIHFRYHGDKPVFLPRTAAILMRPDGHIEWLLSP